MKQIKYCKQPVINSFYDPSSAGEKKINPALLRFSKQVARIAVLDFSKQELKDHYEKDFYQAHITYTYYGREIVAFFIAVFSKKGNDYFGTGFPGIKYKYRKVEKKEDKKIDFKKIMGRLTWEYINCYYKEILKPTKIEPGKSIAKDIWTLFTKQLSYSDIAVKATSIIDKAQKLGKSNNLIIKATAENPIMYATLMTMNLDYWGPNSPKPTSKELSKISFITTARDLLAKSYKQSLRTDNQHPCLIKPAFVVNIPANEWRNFFINVEGKNDLKSKYIKYFLWQNFNFPDTAFLFYFKVNIKNILKAVGNMFPKY